MKIIDPDEIDKKLASAKTKSEKSEKEKIAFRQGFLMEIQHGKFPLIEKFPISYNKGGFKQFETSLNIKMYVAKKHWDDQEDYNSFRFIHETILAREPKIN